MISKTAFGGGEILIDPWVDGDQQQQQQHLLLQAQERRTVREDCVVMLLSTIVVDKDSYKIDKNK
jgi:hypothetical protein